MSTLEQQTAVLNELQKELNLVLERLGRMFAALNANPKVQPIAQKEQLKREIPAANNRFQLHLDELEFQIHNARQILRRDLAVCRERDTLQAQTQAPRDSSLLGEVDHDITMTNVESKADLAQQIPSNTEEDSVESKPNVIEDVKMEDANSVLVSDDTANEPEVMLSPMKAKSETKNSPSSARTDNDPKPTDASDDNHAHSSLPPDMSINTAAQVNDPSVKLEGAKGDEDTAPETANTENNTADLDSLFNGPLSASGEDNDFNFDQEDNSDIDFGGFAGDNDNISSLLPGLQDYANPQFDAASGGDGHEFESMFGMNGAGSEEQPPASAGNGEQETFNFEEFMNSNHFDANGNITSMEGGETSDDRENEQFDFDALFE